MYSVYVDSSVDITINQTLVDITKENKGDTLLIKSTKFLGRSVVHLTQSFWHSIDCALKLIQSIGYLLIAPSNITNDAIGKSWHCLKRSTNSFFRILTANPLTNLFYGYQSEFLLNYMEMKPYLRAQEKSQAVVRTGESDIKNIFKEIRRRPRQASTLSGLSSNTSTLVSIGGSEGQTPLRRGIATSALTAQLGRLRTVATNSSTRERAAGRASLSIVSPSILTNQKGQLKSVQKNSSIAVGSHGQTYPVRGISLSQIQAQKASLNRVTHSSQEKKNNTVEKSVNPLMGGVANQIDKCLNKAPREAIEEIRGAVKPVSPSTSSESSATSVSEWQVGLSFA